MGGAKGRIRIVISIGARHDSYLRVKGGGLILGVGRLQD
jgi:hypothetical protein